jgi:hypothetical protein
MYGVWSTEYTLAYIPAMTTTSLACASQGQAKNIGRRKMEAKR